MSQQDNKEMAKYFYRASAADFKKIPGSPIAYWATEKEISCFDGKKISDLGKLGKGSDTGNNDLFIRHWAEVSLSDIYFDATSILDSIESKKKYFPTHKAGGYQKWYGLREWVVNWFNDGELVKNFGRCNIRNKDYYFSECITWGKITSGTFSARYVPFGSIADDASPSAFLANMNKKALGFMNSRTANDLLAIISPTLNFQVGDISKLPFVDCIDSSKVDELIFFSKKHYDEQEISWDFTIFPLINVNFSDVSLKEIHDVFFEKKSNELIRIKRLEYEIEQSICDLFLTKNNLIKSIDILEVNGLNQLKIDSLSELIIFLISYSIGCMMGRYSLDREGLVYAHAGNVGFNELVEDGAYKTFHADSDGILPLTSEHWFDDDVAARVEEFVRTVWGEEHLEENLQFIAESLCLSAIKPVKNTSEEAGKTIRRYLSTQFFKDHLKTYKKRPIYWLFSSGKEKAFECLVYLHRYNEATLPRMRTEYVSPLLGQMASRIELLRLKKVDAATAEAKRLDKEIDSLTKQLTELRAFDDQLKHYADMRITLDLDDGVKVNYGKFGNLLAEVKAITGDKGE